MLITDIVRGLKAGRKAYPKARPRPVPGDLVRINETCLLEPSLVGARGVVLMGRPGSDFIRVSLYSVSRGSALPPHESTLFFPRELDVVVRNQR